MHGKYEPNTDPLLPESHSQEPINHRRFYSLLILLFGLAAYANTYQVPFIFDDGPNILNNESIRSLWPPWRSFIPSPGIGIAGRPVVNFTFAINHAISGYDVWSYHAINLIIHLTAALVMMGILHRIFAGGVSTQYRSSAGILAFICTAIWMVHPLQTQAVTYTIQRCESLMGLFFLLTLYCSIRGWEKPSGGRWHLAAITAFWAGVGTKEVVVSAPVVVYLFDRIFMGRSNKGVFQTSPLLYGGFAVGWVLLAVLVFSGATAAGTRQMSFTPLEYTLSQFEIITHYLYLVFIPTPLCLDYAWPPASVAAALPYAVFIAVLVGATVYALWKKYLAGLAGAWLFLVLAPTSSVFPLPDPVFEHRMYLPLAAAVVVPVLSIFRLFSKIDRPPGQVRRWKIVAVAATIGVITLLGLLTHARNKDYASQYTIWADTVTKQPENARARNNLGMALHDLGRLAEAETQYRRALEIDPAHINACNNLGIAFFDMGFPSKAARQFETAMRLDPGDADAYHNYGIVLHSMGDATGAIRSFQEALQRNPSHTGAQQNLRYLITQQ